MAVKTITIDMDAYRILDAEKRDKESFSRVIKRVLGNACTAENLLRHLAEVALSEEALDHAEKSVGLRKETLAEYRGLDEV
ncbi:MAG: antitoxin VapB family protein [Lentisphaerae bacterium]|nr:antitoxin VapB family protein [Lentisphaerota bacterium]